MVYTEITDLNDETFALQLERTCVGEKPVDFEFDIVVPKPRLFIQKPMVESKETQYFYCHFGGNPPVIVEPNGSNTKKGKDKKEKKGKKGKKK